MRKHIFLAISHLGALGIGLALGIYLLPILTAPAAPAAASIEAAMAQSQYQVTLTRTLRGNDFLHWGEGKVTLGANQIAHQGELAPGPDYKLYLVKGFVEHEDEFLPLKNTAQFIGDVKSFDGFILDIPEGVNLDDYDSFVIWCEAFSEFITAGQYRS